MDMIEIEASLKLEVKLRKQIKAWERKIKQMSIDYWKAHKAKEKLERQLVKIALPNAWHRMKKENENGKDKAE